MASKTTGYISLLVRADTKEQAHKEAYSWLRLHRFRWHILKIEPLDPDPEIMGDLRTQFLRKVKQ
jgi:hypothetical protein